MGAGIGHPLVKQSVVWLPLAFFFELKEENDNVWKYTKACTNHHLGLNERTIRQRQRLGDPSPPLSWKNPSL